MTKANNIIIIGPMGAGKSTVGKLLAKKLKFTFYDADAEIEKQAGATIPWIFEKEGEAGFRKRESEIIARLTTAKGVVIATGGGAVLAADNRNLMSKRGMVIYLQVSLKDQLKRVMQSKGRPLLNTPDIADKLQKLQLQREPLYQKLADWVLLTDNITPQNLVESIFNWWQEIKLKSII
jgi:shikimate kinase